MNGPNCCDQLRGTPPPMVKMPRRVLLEQSFGEELQVLERIVAQRQHIVLAAHAVVQREVESHLRVGEGGHKHRHILLVGRFQDAALLHVLAEVACRWRGSACARQTISLASQFFRMPATMRSTKSRFVSGSSVSYTRL